MKKHSKRTPKRTLIILTIVTVMSAMLLAACANNSQSGSSESPQAEVDSDAATEAPASGDSAVDWEAVIAENGSDAYVASYTSGDPDILITTHAAQGYDCGDCHGDEMVDMVGSNTEVLDNQDSDVGTREFCLSCHDWDSIVDSTILNGDVTVYRKDGLYNVHDNHRGFVNCNDCHSMHETSTLVCVDCHYLDLPEGWDGFE